MKCGDLRPQMCEAPLNGLLPSPMELATTHGSSWLLLRPTAATRAARGDRPRRWLPWCWRQKLLQQKLLRCRQLRELRPHSSSSSDRGSRGSSARQRLRCCSFADLLQPLGVSDRRVRTSSCRPVGGSDVA